jgi:hypothetical protein
MFVSLFNNSHVQYLLYFILGHLCIYSISVKKIYIYLLYRGFGDRYPLPRDTRAARPTAVGFTGSFKIDKTRIFTRIERRQNRTARCNAACDKNSRF